MLAEAGWIVQDREKFNLGAGLGVAICEFSLRTGTADYLLVVNREVVGTIEAKPLGHSLMGVKEQSAKYLSGVDDTLPVARFPLPFHYETTRQETSFTSDLDPVPRSRLVFSFHRPGMLQEWLNQAPEEGNNETLRSRLLRMPELSTRGLRDCQIEAITNLESSLCEESSSCADPDGDGERENVYRGKLYLSLDQVWQAHAGSSSWWIGIIWVARPSMSSSNLSRPMMVANLLSCKM